MQLDVIEMFEYSKSLIVTDGNISEARKTLERVDKILKDIEDRPDTERKVRNVSRLYNYVVSTCSFLNKKIDAYDLIATNKKNKAEELERVRKENTSKLQRVDANQSTEPVVTPIDEFAKVKPESVEETVKAKRGRPARNA